MFIRLQDLGALYKIPLKSKGPKTFSYLKKKQIQNRIKRGQNMALLKDETKFVSTKNTG